MSDDLLDLYSDYLIVENRYATATGLSASLDQRISHDKITGFLSAREYDSKTLWGIVKKKVREVEQDDGVIIFDDTLSEKPYSEESGLVNWHSDHSKGRCVKGINILNMLYRVSEMSIPIGFEIVKKAIGPMDLSKSKSDQNKNKQMRKLLEQAVNNKVVFKWVIADIWYGGAENMGFIKGYL